PAPDGLEDSDAKELVLRGRDDDVGAVEEPGVFLQVLGVAVMEDAVRVAAEGGLEGGRLLLEVLAREEEAEGAAGIVEPVHRAEERLGVLVVLPALVPEHDGRPAVAARR